MRISCLLIADHLSEESQEWFSRTEEVVDELVIFLRRSSLAKPGRLGNLRAAVYSAPSQEYYFSTNEFRKMVGKCSGEWVLVLDHDEELSREWDDPNWRTILDETAFTHFYLPRRWLTSKDTFLAREPWWPDWQLRLFRNDPAKVHFPERLHDTYRIEGCGGWLPNLAIHHHDLRLASRDSREKKAKLYRSLREDHDLGYFYLYEDFYVPETPLPFPPGSLEHRTPPMNPLTPDEARAVQVVVKEIRCVMRTGHLYWIRIKVKNSLDRYFGLGSPYPVNIAYHWLEAESQRMIVFDGVRTAIVPALPPEGERDLEMLIVPPVTPGQYLLQIALVQESVRWFEPLTFAVRVDTCSNEAEQNIVDQLGAGAVERSSALEEVSQNPVL